MYVLSALMIEELTFLSLWIALFAGIVSFLSPCVFPLVPAYLAQLTGAEIQENKLMTDRRIILSRSLGFILGFTTIFLALGASSSFLGGFFLENQRLVSQLGGIVIAMFGLQLAGVFQMTVFMSEKRLKNPGRATSFGRSVLFGLIFAAGWSPCIGLVLGSILLLAAPSGDPVGGMVLLFSYSIGLGIPFLLTALIFARSIHKIRRMNRFLPAFQKFGGIVMVILGVLLFTGLFNRIAAYLSQFTIM
ncbi:cytochrome c biogenesis CcdA family protein [Alkalicoccus urumqiensis]|uniref:Cytochrome c biogenesis protein CcdA n=1 Tax=Alkalicoccus urumqiensis TaxID=1548213 RepID=A0A2P6MFH4_ALKUR|nr:cytochrome c biogenesis CcdA family protein [Alkalicoccus urumqiensis]PRO64991.1 cytochrome c biogenesis protein CcdA [Alkalicoccus urumqiensis]